MTPPGALPDTTAIHLPGNTPPALANSFIGWLLKAPLIERWLGKSLARFTFTGRHTGTTYTIPVSYRRGGDTVTVVTKKLRKWWHNFETPAEVRLRLAGRDYRGMAHIETDSTAALAFMLGYLSTHPIDARAYGLSKDEVNEDSIGQIMAHVVVIRIELDPNTT